MALFVTTTEVLIRLGLMMQFVAITDSLPNEVLAIILECCIRDYFSRHRLLSERLPAPLLVCHKWRNLAISTPACWSNLKIYIDTRSMMKYTCQNVSCRNTKSEAIQDTLNCYFNWAKDFPIDLSIQFSDEFGKRVKDAMIYWISSNMPRLRSYRDAGKRSLFVPMLPAVSMDRFNELTELEIATPAYDFKATHTVSMPKLRVLRLRTDTALHHVFMNHLNSPNLRTLCVSGDYLRLIVTAFECFPLLEELAILHHVNWERLSTETLTPHPKSNRLKRIIIEGTRQGIPYLFSTCRSWFPSARDWTITDDVLRSALSEKKFTEKLALGCVEALSIQFHSPSTSDSVVARLNECWDYFPNIVHLTLGSITRHWGSTIDFRSAKTGVAIGALIRSLGLKSEGSLSFRNCPGLKSIEIRSLDLSLDVLNLLLDILQLRSSSTIDAADLGNEDTGFRLTISRSKYSYNDKDSASVEVWNASYSEFKSLVDNLRIKTHSAYSNL